MDSPSFTDSAESPSLDDSADTSLLTVRDALPSDDRRNKKSYVNRWHYRIVYKEIAVPYADLRNSKDMALVLEHVVKCESAPQMDESITNIELYYSSSSNPQSRMGPP